MLVQRLETADSVGERRAYLDVLKGVDPKPSLLLPMLSHPQWYVVEAATELLGTLAVEEAIPAIGAGLHHQHAKVREAAAIALARLATGPALDQLRQALSADRDDVRQAVARSIGGRASSALAMPLVNLVEVKDIPAETMRECYRALVRIGTPAALKAVLTAAEPGGRVLGRKPTPRRVAAVEALARSADAAVKRKLGEIAKGDREKPVREAAARAMAGAEAGDQA
jgi:HEAT repeat protein